MKLLTPVKLGNIDLKNRMVMAPCTRMRSDHMSELPGDNVVEYYKQRASAGLIVTEGVNVSRQGKGYPGTPSIYTTDHATAWKKVTDAVHSVNGKIVCQLWHVGRISHSSIHPEEGLPVGPSSIRPLGMAVFTSEMELVLAEEPRELTSEEIADIVQSYKNAAEMAKLAGFDGVEITSANGYLIDQFLNSWSNKRTDLYGGSIENKSRLLFEIISAVCEVWDSQQVGVRLSPYGRFNDVSDSNTSELFNYIIKSLNECNLAYLHLIQPRAILANLVDHMSEAPDVVEQFKHLFKNSMIVAGGYDKESAEDAVTSKDIDAVAFGRFFIANPDLPQRFEQSLPLNPYDRKTFYSGGNSGYIDYKLIKDSK